MRRSDRKRRAPDRFRPGQDDESNNEQADVAPLSSRPAAKKQKQTKKKGPIKTALAPPVAVEPPPPPPVPQQQQQQQQQQQPQQAVVAVPVAVPVQWTAAEVEAANCKLREACWRDDAVAAAAALDGGAEVESVSFIHYGLKPLHWAADKGSVACITLLLDRGADVNGRDVYDLTPLHLAVSFGHTACATLLLDRGADVNARSKSNWTPLHYAALKNDQASCAQLLLDRGADPFIRTSGADPFIWALALTSNASNAKKTPADYAQEHNKPGVLRVLTAHAIRPCLPAGVRELTDIVADYLLGKKPGAPSYDIQLIDLPIPVQLQRRDGTIAARFY